MFTSVIALLSIATIAHAHLCMLAPTQRGGVAGINTHADPICAVLAGPCGNTTAHHPSISIRSAVPFNVVFQKNLDHYYASNPGSFVIDLAMNKNPQEGDFKPLKKIADSATPTGYIYAEMVSVPIVSTELEGVLRVRYITNNPGAPPVFYQCSDVSLM
eukprot:TRINITY_DN2213_c0_g1_i2.p1 TRINITY_DN2213_c0_g1~~TRINITY_DN2213_c0_g1_i2.p1  ORF type:complete len:159 (-),score=39.97 TRINITY_DN2213_c0_g1_i2:59-535(-)